MSDKPTLIQCLNKTTEYCLIQVKHDSIKPNFQLEFQNYFAETIELQNPSLRIVQRLMQFGNISALVIMRTQQLCRNMPAFWHSASPFDEVMSGLVDSLEGSSRLLKDFSQTAWVRLCAIIQESPSARTQSTLSRTIKRTVSPEMTMKRSSFCLRFLLSGFIRTFFNGKS